jgi:hypothetical protein
VVPVEELLEIDLSKNELRAREKSPRWLRQALQYAVSLELATIPPYLCALWSIIDLDPTNYVVSKIRRIVKQEMAHLGQACNLMTAYGWNPKINRRKTIPHYPGPLPGGLHKGLVVGLRKLSRDLIGNVFMQIEFPSAEAVTTYGDSPHATIGGFYEVIRDVVRAAIAPITGDAKFQLDASTFGLIQIMNPDDAVSAIDRIRLEGEGAHGSPFVHPGQPAHFYQFAEFFWGRKIQPCGAGGWGFCGDTIALPEVFPMAPVPAGGYPNLPEAMKFNKKYTAVLDLLQTAWETGDQQALDKAVDDFMKAPDQKGTMQYHARKLMTTKRPDGMTYGPDFRYLK